MHQAQQYFTSQQPQAGSRRYLAHSHPAHHQRHRLRTGATSCGRSNSAMIAAARSSGSSYRMSATVWVSTSSRMSAARAGSSSRVTTTADSLGHSSRISDSSSRSSSAIRTRRCVRDARASRMPWPPASPAAWTPQRPPGLRQGPSAHPRAPTRERRTPRCRRDALATGIVTLDRVAGRSGDSWSASGG